MCGVCLVGTSSPFADLISNSPLFVVMSFASFSSSIVNFLASLIKASYYYYHILMWWFACFMLACMHAWLPTAQHQTY
jgi:hypothetical protein